MLKYTILAVVIRERTSILHISDTEYANRKTMSKLLFLYQLLGNFSLLYIGEKLQIISFEVLCKDAKKKDAYKALHSFLTLVDKFRHR